MIAYATAMARAWKAFAPAWEPAPELIDRERERADVAAANDTQLELLDRLHPTAHVFNGGWRLPSLLRAGQAHFPDGGLIVLPLLADPRASIVSSQHDCITHLAYPVSSGPGRAAAGPGSLDSLVGIPRATILRRTAIPRTVGELAVGLMTVPSAVTYHANALVAAGLVVRERRGKHVIVRRTARGEALILLYNEA
jgi:DNA-binding transcriptional ArsR family regulator